MVTFIPGRLANDPSKPRVRMGAALTGAPPVAVDYYSAVPSIGMLGNDQYGDCVFAGNGHVVEQQTRYGQGAEVAVTTAQALAEYSRVTGFSPDDPASDQGAMIQDGLNDLKKAGLAGHKIAGFGELPVSDMAKVQLAVAEFGAVSIGINFPAVAMDQFDAGKPWDVVKDDGGIEGGHCVVVAGYDATYLYVFTWGKVQRMTYAWWAKYVEEAWAVVSQDWVSAASGKDPEGVDLVTLGAEFLAVTGQNPFPSPPAPPAPGPAPVPVPTPAPPKPPKPSWLEQLIEWIEEFFA